MCIRDRLGGQHDARAQADKQRQQEQDIQPADRRHGLIVQAKHKQQIGDADARQHERRRADNAGNQKEQRLPNTELSPHQIGRKQPEQSHYGHTDQDIDRHMP